MSRNRLLRGGATAVVLTAVAVLFGRALVDNWDRVREIPITVNGWSVLAVLLFAGAVVVSGMLWGHMVGRLGSVRVPVTDAVRVQCASWLLKYVPGQVGSVANKVLWAGDRGLSRTLVVITFVYENVFLLLGSVIPAGIVLLVADAFVDAPDDVVGSFLALLLALIPLLLVTDRRVFRWGVNLVAGRVLRRDAPDEYFLVPRDALAYQMAFLVPRVINGIGFVLVAVSFLEIEPRAFVPLAAIYVLAGAVGIMAVFVPSGLGVRESVIVLLASRYMPLEQAIVLSLVARLYSTLGDGLIALVYAGLKVLHLKRGRPS